MIGAIINYCIILSLVTTLSMYLPWRLGNLLALKNMAWLYALFFVGLISSFATISLITKFDTIFVRLYYNLTWTWMGIFIFLCCFMMVFEAVNLIYKLPPAKAAWTVIALTAAVSAYALLNAASFKVTNVSIPIKNLGNEVRIVQISDIHLGVSRSESYLEKIVEKTNKLNPDFVVLTGDIADSKLALSKNMFRSFKDLQAPAYFVYGNHDVYIGLDEIIKNLEENNVVVLQNEVVTTNGIQLVGINYMKADDSVYDPHQVTDDTIKNILPTLPLRGGEPVVLLHHGPWGIEYMNRHGVDLVLAGHTHAGQIFPATIMAGLSFPYTRGLAEYNGTFMYVSQGAGTFLSRMRLGTRNEITFISLKP